MKKQHSTGADFEAARIRAGLRQIDAAHLLGVQKSRISHIENGDQLPTVRHAVMLSIVYGKPLEALLSGLLDEVVDKLIEGLRTMPPASPGQPGTANRADTLSQLAIQLKALTSSRHEAA